MCTASSQLQGGQNRGRKDADEIFILIRLYGFELGTERNEEAFCRGLL